MNQRLRHLAGSVLVLIFLFASHAGAEVPANRTTLVWLSIDALRHDYVQRTHAPTLSRLEHEGAYTNQESPIFPSLTYPNHSAQVTGKLPEKSGVISNAFWDRQRGKSYNLPNDSSLFRAEPIWVTAKRQGLRAAVFDWPMSAQQSGPNASDYSFAYDAKQNDRQRLERAAATVKSDHPSPAAPPLRLIIVYVSAVDHAGHKFGPDAKETDQEILDTDALVGEFLRSIIEWFDSAHAADDQLYVLITTDHGMMNVTKTVSLDQLIGPELAEGARLITSGPLANLYLDQLPPAQQPARADQILARLKADDFLQAWKRADVPAKFHCSDATRQGDAVVLLAPGYTFNRTAATRPSFNPQLGMHGYDPQGLREMQGTAIIWHYKHPMGGKDLGPIENTQWHATVAKVLGIAPAEGSDPRAVEIP